MATANAFWPTAVVGEADSVNSLSASLYYIGGPKRVNPRYLLFVSLDLLSIFFGIDVIVF